MTSRNLRAAAAAVAALLAATLGTTAVTTGQYNPVRWFTTSPGKAADRPTVSASPSAPTTPSIDTSSSVAAPSPSECPVEGGWDCPWRERLAAAAAYVSTRPGSLSIIVGDLGTDAVWRAGPTTDVTWTASTIKLAMAATLLERQRAGEIALTATDRTNLDSALTDSSNEAATALWNRYGGSPMIERFRSRYGMTSLSVVPGYEVFWRHLRCSTEDLYHLMTYVLVKMPPDDRAYLVSEMRSVADNQHWGVWAAGAGLRPGNKDGWAQKPDPEGTHWVTHSVGFAGPGERYVVAVMDRLPPSGSLAEGVQTVSDLVATVFGAPVPASVKAP